MRGVVLVNIGSPKSPTRKDVASYLRRFLSDSHVMNMPSFFRWLLVNVIIVPIRSGRSAKRYSAIWNGSQFPLVAHMENLTEKVRRLLDPSSDIIVEAAMRYGEPSIETVTERLAERGVSEILLIPLYPHNAFSTVGSTVDAMKKALKKHDGINLTVAPPFYDSDDYIDAMVSSLENVGDDEELLFSFHGVPLSHLNCDCASECNASGDVDVSRTSHCRDCYRYQCYKSAAAVALKMGREKRYRVAFQSRFGNGKWLAPTLSDTLRECLACGSSKVAVCAPSFTADCLETLNEIDVEERVVFEREGGKMSYHPCLNDNDSWCLSVKNMITDWLKQN